MELTARGARLQACCVEIRLDIIGPGVGMTADAARQEARAT